MRSNTQLARGSMKPYLAGLHKHDGVFVNEGDNKLKYRTNNEVRRTADC